MKPPHIRELMDDPVYRAYVRTPPDPYRIYAGTALANPSLTLGQPWQVWVHTTSGTWKTGKFGTYAQAFNTMARAVRASSAEDVALVSRRVFFSPPGEWESYRVRVRDPKTQATKIVTRQRWVQTFHWDHNFEWCGRCRRPTTFRELHWTHHALRNQPCLTDDAPYRCIYCGIRREAMK